MQPGLQPDSVQGAGRHRSADLLPPLGWLLNSVPSRPAPVVVWLDRGMATVLQVRVPTTARPVPATMGALAVITIGIDPHKASLTAVAVDPSGRSLGHRRLLVNAGTLSQLAAWAAAWPARRFAVEGAYGLGRPSPISWPPPANRSWTYRPPWPPGPGC